MSVKYKATVRKSGNSLAVRIPKELAKDAGLVEGAEVPIRGGSAGQDSLGSRAAAVKACPNWSPASHPKIAM